MGVSGEKSEAGGAHTSTHKHTQAHTAGKMAYLINRLLQCLQALFRMQKVMKWRCHGKGSQIIPCFSILLVSSNDKDQKSEEKMT